MPQETLGYVKLEWTCPKCGGRNLGTEKTCLSCRALQPQDVQFEQTEAVQASQEEALKAIAEAGPDIHCPFCGTRNPASAAVCSQCGGDLKEGARRIPRPRPSPLIITCWGLPARMHTPVSRSGGRVCDCQNSRTPPA